jgi:hypothetical protein
MNVARSKAGVEVAACSEPGHDAAVCSRVGIEDAGGGGTDIMQHW